jgi:hypothetical protein
LIDPVLRRIEVGKYRLDWTTEPSKSYLQKPSPALFQVLGVFQSHDDGDKAPVLHHQQTILIAAVSREGDGLQS